MSEARIDSLSNESNTGGPTLSGITTFSGTNYFVPPVGTTAQRPQDPQKGSIRFNTDTYHLEYYRGDTIGWSEIEASHNQLGGGTGSSAGLGTRGLIMGGIISGRTSNVDFVTIDTTGNAADFGDLVQSASQGGGIGSRTRAIAGGGTPSTPAGTNNIDFHEFASTGTFNDFGDMNTTGFERIALSNSTRGVFMGRIVAPNSFNEIEYITIASTGNAKDFGNLTANKSGAGAAGNSTRAIHCGGSSPHIACDYVTIASTGNAADFGDLTSALSNTRGGNCGNAVRGLMSGGNGSGNVIQYVTISTLGNSVDFGDRSVAKSQIAHMSSTTRAVFAGAGEGDDDTIDYVQISTTGDAVDFGNLVSNYGYAAGASNGHGGL